MSQGQRDDHPEQGARIPRIEAQRRLAHDHAAHQPKVDIVVPVRELRRHALIIGEAAPPEQHEAIRASLAAEPVDGTGRAELRRAAVAE